MRAVAADRIRLIPAHAGKTTRWCAAWLSSPAHPRSRGENAAGGLAGRAGSGSSPLTRGKLDIIPEVGPVVGLIPAHAGKTKAVKASRR